MALYETVASCVEGTKSRHITTVLLNNAIQCT